MLEEVLLYLTALMRVSASFFPSSVPTFLAKWTRSIWSILVDWANSRVLLLATETSRYSLLLIFS